MFLLILKASICYFIDFHFAAFHILASLKLSQWYLTIAHGLSWGQGLPERLCVGLCCSSGGTATWDYHKLDCLRENFLVFIGSVDSDCKSKWISAYGSDSLRFVFVSLPNVKLKSNNLPFCLMAFFLISHYTGRFHVSALCRTFLLDCFENFFLF